MALKQACRHSSYFGMLWNAANAWIHGRDSSICIVVLDVAARSYGLESRPERGCPAEGFGTAGSSRDGRVWWVTRLSMPDGS